MLIPKTALYRDLSIIEQDDFKLINWENIKDIKYEYKSKKSMLLNSFSSGGPFRNNKCIHINLNINSANLNKKVVKLMNFSNSGLFIKFIDQVLDYKKGIR